MVCRRNTSSRSDGVAPQTLAFVNGFKMIRWFLTQDEDLLFGETSRAIVVLSRARQSRPLKDRIEIWRNCVRELLQASKPERLYELMDNGALLPWRDISNDT